MQITRLTAATIAALAIGLPSLAMADDWLVTKLRGNAAQLVDGKWLPLHRGDIVPDDRAIHTLEGRLSLQRGKETIDLGSQTAIRIVDRNGQQFTTVRQYFGTVGVEAEVRDVQHFAVQTPHIAAVVKGTRFTVHSDEHGAEVSVERGRVAVKDGDTGQSVLLGVGQSASTSDGGGNLEVSGDGDLPVIHGVDGRTIASTSSGKSVKDKKSGDEGTAGGKNDGNSANGNSGNSNSGGGNSGNGNSGNSNAGGNGNGRNS
jgi:hypothetical protein